MLELAEPEDTMVFDTVENASRYKTLGPRIARALSFIETVQASEFNPHKAEIEGDDVFANFQDTSTEPAEGRDYEAHRTYIDVQFIVAGEEVIRVTKLSLLSETVPYDADRDIAFFGPAPGNDIHLRPGDFLILFPEDAHLPKIAAGAPGTVQKIVVKVRV